MGTKTVTSKHGRAGHDITVDYKSGILFCLTCKQHVLSDAEAAGDDLLEVLEALYENCAMIHKFGGEHSNAKEADAVIAKGRAVIAAAKGESGNALQTN